MIIVSGRIFTKQGKRDDFLDGSREAVAAARKAEGCRDFSVSADAIDTDRVNVYEEWQKREDDACLSRRRAGRRSLCADRARRGPAAHRNHHARLIVRNGEPAPVPTPPPTAEWPFPAPIGVQPVQCVPMGEVILLTRHLRVNSITSYMNLRPLQDLRDASTPPPDINDDRGRSGQRFVLEARVSRGDIERRAYARGQDIYAASATLIVHACLAVLHSPRGVTGVRAVGGILEPRSLLRGLSPDILVHLDDPLDA